MQGYTGNIEDLTLNNNNFRQVLYTGKHMQLVLMTLQVGEEIGEEIHETVDQFFRIEEGQAKVVVDGEEVVIGAEEVYIVLAGSKHNVINVGDKALKLYTIYAPPNHPDGTVHANKAEADAYEAEHHH